MRLRNDGTEVKTADDYEWEAFRWESAEVKARTVDSFGIILSSYGSVTAAHADLARDRARQAADGLRPGELDYRTVTVKETT